MLPPEEAERGLISSISKPQDVTGLLRDGVTPESFLHYGPIFEHYLKYVREYDDVPQHRDVEAEFKILDFTYREPGEVKFYAREVLDNELIRRTNACILDRFGENGSKMQQNPSETIRLVCEDLRKLQKTSLQHVAYLDRDALMRLGWLYEKAERNRQGKVLGIPTGFACFDRATQGWAPGEAIMIMAPKGTGKSWVALYIGTVGYRAGYKVLFLSPEMSWEECAPRFDVLMAYQVGQSLSHSAITSGQQEVAPYEQFLKELTRRDQFIVVDSPEVGGFTTANVLGLIDEHRPDLVILDGLHLIGGDEPSGWERIKNAADSFKAAAQHLKCSIVWTSQVDREAMRNPTEPAASGASAAYGKAAVEAANRLITLANHDRDSRLRTFKVPNNRSGREFHIRQELMFDVDIGAVYQIDTRDGEEPQQSF